MANQTIQSWAQTKGLSMPSDDTALFRTESGYLFTYAYLARNSVNVFVPVREENWSKETKKALETALKKAGILFLQKGLVRVNVGGTTQKAFHEAFEQVTQILLAELPRLGIRPADTCHHCGQGDCDDTVLEDGACYPSHSRCNTQRAETLLAEVEDNQMNGNIPLGIVGAILGGIIGSVPSFLTAHFFDTIFSILFALIPVASYVGYKKFKGLMNMVTPFLISIISLLCTVFLVISYNYTGFLAELLPEDMEVLEAMGETPLSFFLSYFFGPEMRSDMLSTFLQPIIFCGVGIYIAWGIISRNNRHKKKEAYDLMNR